MFGREAKESVSQGLAEAQLKFVGVVSAFSQPSLVVRRIIVLTFVRF